MLSSFASFGLVSVVARAGDTFRILWRCRKPDTAAVLKILVADVRKVNFRITASRINDVVRLLNHFDVNKIKARAAPVNTLLVIYVFQGRSKGGILGCP